MESSFKKKSNRGHSSYPAGTKISLRNNQLLISTGVPSLDSLLGGGLAVGTVLLIEEDNYACYSKTLLKCFLAEGVVSRHSLFLATAGHDPEEIWKNLPCAVDDVNETGASDVNKPPEGDQSMKIAWRYENMPKVRPAAVKFGHFFDFTKTVDVSRINKVSKYEYKSRDTWSGQDGDSQCQTRSSLNPEYRNLLNSIRKVIEENGHSTTNKEIKDRVILRIAIQSLESPLWCNHSDEDHSLTMFLYYLRGILRSSFAVCLITIPSYIHQDLTFINRVERLCDTVVKFESFAGSEKETNPIYKDYHGLFHIVRLPRLNSLTSFMPETLDLAFKLRRRKFLIEKLHLPPDVGEISSDGRKDPLSKNTGAYGCGASLGGSKLDF
ncbi:elongator complex protein 4-like [Dendronephthya gigantea]|uniref:elongator complex protein 4-like n=1 Tax=Dendronephthya gigantea TaxID=151771 RepID=UPI00106D6DA3|nr:elongator complex protein 4-like [Dendronephthya gigantea]